MRNKISREAKIRWEKLHKSISKKSNPFARMSKEEVINALRKTREELWGKKLAARP